MCKFVWIVEDGAFLNSAKTSIQVNIKTTTTMHAKINLGKVRWTQHRTTYKIIKQLHIQTHRKSGSKYTQGYLQVVALKKSFGSCIELNDLLIAE